MKLKVAVAQLNSNNDIERNVSAISELVILASLEKAKPNIIFFPENSLYFRIDQSAELPNITLEHQAIQRLELLSKQTLISLHVTSSFFINGKNWNASVLIQPGQKANVIYKKIHLFDIQLLEQKPIKESDVYSHGEKSITFNFNDFKFGSAICYDVRFAELFSLYAKQEVDTILLPAAFLVKTGKVHWETLLRARAIESQCYVLAPAQVGIHQDKQNPALVRETFGHSMIINPWGEVIELKKESVGLIYTDLDSALIESVRRQIPMKDHRRL